jgi:hypothetical protein
MLRRNQRSYSKTSGTEQQLISNVCHECREGCFGTTRKGNSMGSNSQHQASLYNMADALCSDLFYDNNLAHFTSQVRQCFSVGWCPKPKLFGKVWRLFWLSSLRYTWIGSVGTADLVKHPTVQRADLSMHNPQIIQLNVLTAPRLKSLQEQLLSACDIGGCEEQRSPGNFLRSLGSSWLGLESDLKLTLPFFIFSKKVARSRVGVGGSRSLEQLCRLQSQGGGGGGTGAGVGGGVCSLLSFCKCCKCPLPQAASSRSLLWKFSSLTFPLLPESSFQLLPDCCGCPVIAGDGSWVWFALTQHCCQCCLGKWSWEVPRLLQYKIPALHLSPGRAVLGMALESL